MSAGTTVVLQGPSSAGKSTVAAALQACWPGPLQVVGLDTVLACQSASFFAPGPDGGPVGLLWEPGPDGVAIRTGARGRAVVAAAHTWWRACAEAGTDQVVDDVWLERPSADGLTAALAGLPVLWVGVRCPLPELERRERARGDRTRGQARWQAGVVHGWRGYDLELDTSLLGPQECAAAVLRALG